MKHTIHFRSSVYIWQSNRHILFYDTSSYSSIILPITNNTRFFFNQLKQPTALYSFSFDDIKNPEVYSAVKILCSKGFGVEETDNERYISLPPFLGINNNWEILKREGKHGAILELLRTVSFVVGTNSLCCSVGSTHLFDHEIQPNDFLDLNELYLFFKRNNLSYIKHVNFIIGDNPPRDYLKNLKQLIFSYQLQSIVKIYLVNNSKHSIEVINCFKDSFDLAFVNLAMPYIIIKGFDEYCFVVHSFEELSAAEKCIKDYGLQKYTIRPRYNGSNTLFMEEVFFPRIDDIMKEKISKRLIQIHQTLNLNYFGHLFVSPDSKVYSHPFKPPIGHLSDGLYSLVYNEMDKNYLWRKTRECFGPCSNCIYRDLCPSPILEEELMGRVCNHRVV